MAELLPLVSCDKEWEQRPKATSHSACSDAYVQTLLPSPLCQGHSMRILHHTILETEFKAFLGGPTGSVFHALLGGPILPREHFSANTPVISWLQNPHFLADIKARNFLYHLIPKNMEFIELSSALMVIILFWEKDVSVKRPPNTREAERSKHEVGKSSLPASE